MSWFNKNPFMWLNSWSGSNSNRRQSVPSTSYSPQSVPSTSYSPQSVPLPIPSTIVIDSQGDHDDSTADDLDSEVLFGSLRGNIVGIRYYKGTVNNKEMVALEREPMNPYDCNAIMVKNVLGEQVGHIKRELAKALALVVDKKCARLEGIVPFGMDNMYSMPVDLSLWGNPINKEAALRILRSQGYRVNKPDFEGGTNSSQQLYSAQPRRTLLTAAEVKNELDKLFESLTEEDKFLESDATEAIGTSLYPHQRQALYWMIQMENSKTLPPFWEERNGKFYNTVTVFTSKKRPQSICGGILADDMGLGKTLEMITLIISNFVDGKPLAVPVPGKIGESRLVRMKQKEKYVSAVRKKLDNDRSGVKRKRKQLHAIDVDVLSLPQLPSDSETNASDTGESKNDCAKLTKQNSQKQSVKKARGNGKKKSQAESILKTKNARACEMLGNLTRIKTVSTEEEAEVKPTALMPGSGESRQGGKLPSSLDHSALQVKLNDTDSKEEPDISIGTPGQSKCGKFTGRTAAKGARATLIVCPLSVLSTWLDQFEIHIHENVHLEIYTYYGQGRVKDSGILSKQDIVLTTYNTLAADLKGGSPLSKVNWLRIVLDEGHTIRNPNALHTKAIMELKAERKWVLTGTPIQNAIKDLWSLVNFLQISPFTDRQWWHRTIERPLDHGDHSALKRIQHLMASIALRRTKTMMVGDKPLIKLPERNVFIEHVKLSEDERSIYNAMQTEGKLQVSKYFKLGTFLNNYGSVLAILMRLRQLCCHPLLLAKATAAIQETLDSSEYGCHISEDLRQKLIGTLMTVLGSGSDEECAICLDALKNATITHCAHVYCRACIEAVIKSEKPTAHCPLCRGDLSADKLFDVPVDVMAGEMDCSDVTAETWKSSAKVDALMCALQKLREEDKSIKSLVVSQFTSMLSLLEIPLRMQGFNFVRLDGSMSAKARTQSIQSFSDESAGSPTIILLSLKAGGVGINLTSASRVFLIDPAWNPASEEQVFDRCHRLGQTKDVVITKFIVEDSVEERMLELQEKKRNLMQGAFSKKMSQDEKRQNRIKDLKNLMNF